MSFILTGCIGVSSKGLFGTGVSVALDPRTVGTQIDDSIMQKSLAAKIIARDKKYILSNKRIKSDKDLMLHAYSLKFYINNKKFFYKANPPAAFNKYLNKKKLNILNS